LFGKHLFQILRLAWEQMLDERKLPVYELANKARCFYFPKDRVPSDRVSFTGVDGDRTYRAMVGYSTRTNPTTGVSAKRYWHYAVQARPQVHPMFAYIFKSHVLFTSDGRTIWESKKKLASARRSQCKSWWNDEWRDRALAAATYLCDGTDKITLTLGSKAVLTIPPMPVLFCSPVSYTDPQLLRFSEDDEIANDYGRDTGDEKLLKMIRKAVPNEGSDPYSRAASFVQTQSGDGRPARWPHLVRATGREQAVWHPGRCHWYGNRHPEF
jgi:hypothetical protein